ncbi:MAG: PQQ-dependent sugar dehydrogenase [Proteobacteria bacterium]|nr:PQQ-dependent sugar dehydrogenase [Pseudomonadota bacterium]
MRRLALVLALALSFAAGAGARVEAAEPDELARIKLPPGFRIEVFATVPNARSLVVAEDLGVVFVGTRGSIVWIVPLAAPPAGRVREGIPLIRGLAVANGVARKGPHLFIAEQPRIVRYAIQGSGTGLKIVPEAALASLPNKGWHGWRYAAIGPDGLLYVAVGSPCNVCRTRDPEGTIVRITPEGGPLEVFARGIRNSVGMDFHPATGELFFTDNGADNLGDDVPADEFNHAPRPGLDFGFPWYGGGRTRTPDFAGQAPPPGLVFPAVEFDAHTASLGVHFYSDAMFPAEYRGDALVAQHGSWNRSVPIGYRVVRVRFAGGRLPVGAEVFAEGWLNADGSRWGRPVDVKSLADGSLLISDDEGGVIYRISYAARR